MVQSKGNHMIHVILALLIASSLYLSMGGAIWATNIIIGILVLNITLVVLSITTVVGFQKTILMNAEKRIGELDSYAEKMDTSTLLLLRVLLLLGVWHLYTLGYILFAGIAGTTVIISIIIMLFSSLDVSKDKKE
jgi:hypothetical protein